jgi:hypothetical protein
MRISRCPQCRGKLEKGFVQAPSFGVCWMTDPKIKLGFVFSKKVRKLQKDWWGFPKLSKDKLKALRCRKCRIVIFHYTGD